MNRLGNNFVDGMEEKSMEHQESMEKATKKKEKYTALASLTCHK